jgi:hypothetical protein
MIKGITGAVVIVLSVLSSTSCTGGSTVNVDTAAIGWPQGLEDFTITWTAEPGIDLSAGASVPVRAYLESFFLAEATGNPTYGYPGFVDAVPESLRPAGKTPTTGPWVGTETNHLLSLTRTGGDVTAIGCMYTYGAASSDADGKYVAHGYPPGGIAAGIPPFKVTLSAPSGSGQAQRGQPTDECRDKAPDPLERRQALTGNFPPRSDFRTLPARPGWPAKPAS